jgi:hypothetical protein
MQTELTLSLGGLPPLSARGCVQELTSVPQGEFKRSLNGELIFVGNPQHKYKTTLHCSDQSVMATNGLAIGAEVVVGCIQALCHKIPPSDKAVSLTLERTPVPGTLAVVTENGDVFEAFTSQGLHVTVDPSKKELFVYYQPLLTMRVVSFSLKTEEWPQKVAWVLDLEEI